MPRKATPLTTSTTSAKRYSAVPTIARTTSLAAAASAAATATVMAAVPAAAAAAAAPATVPAATVPAAAPAEEQPTAGPSEANLALIAALRSNDAVARQDAAVALGRAGERGAVASLGEALRDPVAEVARDAATSLGLIGDATAIDGLAIVLANHDNFFHSVVRAAAAASLGQLADPRAVLPLVGAISDPMAEASAEAVRALASLGDRRAVEPLVEVLRNANGYFLPVVRRAAVIALASLGGESALAAVRAVAQDQYEDAVVRQTAADHGQV